MRPFSRKPLWYKDAVIYEAHIKSYHDSDGDGMGDFPGLISKLDYIRDLGVDTIWLLPFYPSPLRDDGYDISDYRSVNPSYGTLDDFRTFLDEAHARGIHVVTEVVINHTSDKHPWFERARRAPAGSPERDFYVWSHTKEKYKHTRIIFKDYEPSNWTWDPVAKAHYWHRFYHHQPDLNFDNPAVHDAVLEILDYWLDMGVDGVRLDAIPYLYEREGTSCENLPETHAFLRKLAAHVNAKYDHRLLLAEANQWPDDAAAYFGKGDSCNMAFHFPLMTRLYMAVETEDRFPVVDILDQTPEIPDNCQWAVFLRNHDELTLEMVTDEERDYMYRMFAKDRRARINLGIRRRLAPLLGNNRRKIELLNSLLLSLPGTPVIYYGDEIGMGDNIYLGDRDGVRTPMQWSADRNAGFSRAPAQRLYLPVIADSEHHYEAVNVEAQESNPSSLLWWMRRRIRLRQAHPVFGRGNIRFLEPENGRILAFVRECADEAILVVANLSQYPQTAQLDLEFFQGVEPVELTGGTRFPKVDTELWPIMLGGHECLWLLLRKHVEDAGLDHHLPDLGAWEDLPGLVRNMTQADGRAPDFLEEHLVRAPWFAGKSRLLARVRIRQSVNILDPAYAVLILTAEFLQGDAEAYSLWLGFVPGDTAVGLPPHARVARLTLGGVAGELCEAQYIAAFRSDLVMRLMRPSRAEEAASAGFHIHVFPGAELVRPPERALTQLIESDPSEFRILMHGRLLLRWFRRLNEGHRSDLDTLQEVKSRFPKARVPVCLVRADWAPPGARRSSVGLHGVAEGGLTLGYVQRFVHAERTAHDLAQEGLQHFLRGTATVSGDREALLPLERKGFTPSRLDFQQLDPESQELLGGPWSEFAFLLGQRLAELHRVLLRCGATNPEFTAEPFTLLHQYSMFHSIRGRLRRALAYPERLDAAMAAGGVEESVRMGVAAGASASQPVLLGLLRKLVDRKIDGQRLRVHGDLRLERVLFTGKDYVFTSFDGPPWLTGTERSFRFSPLHDVAALIRALLRVPDEILAVDIRHDVAGGLDENTRKWARKWADLSAGLLLDGYLDTAEKESWLPRAESDCMLLLEAFMMERLAYEVHNVIVDPARAAGALREMVRAANALGNEDSS